MVVRVALLAGMAGRHPSGSPDGRFLALACASCDELRTFSIDAVTGALAVTGAATVPDVRDVARLDETESAAIEAAARQLGLLVA